MERDRAIFAAILVAVAAAGVLYLGWGFFNAAKHDYDSVAKGWERSVKPRRYDRINEPPAQQSQAPAVPGTIRFVFFASGAVAILAAAATWFMLSRVAAPRRTWITAQRASTLFFGLLLTGVLAYGLFSFGNAIVQLGIDSPHTMRYVSSGRTFSPTGRLLGWIGGAIILASVVGGIAAAGAILSIQFDPSDREAGEPDDDHDSN